MPASVTMIQKWGCFCRRVRDGLVFSVGSRTLLLRRDEAEDLLDLLCFLVSDLFRNPALSLSVAVSGCSSTEGGGDRLIEDSVPTSDVTGLFPMCISVPCFGVCSFPLRSMT